MESELQVWVGGATFVLGLLGFAYRLFCGLMAANTKTQEVIGQVLRTQTEILKEMRTDLRWLRERHASADNLCSLSRPHDQRNLADEIALRVNRKA